MWGGFTVKGWHDIFIFCNHGCSVRWIMVEKDMGAERLGGRQLQSLSEDEKWNKS